jgi:thioredoxin 1
MYKNMITIREIKSLEDLKSFYAESPDSLHLVKIGAKWCGPCRILSDILHNMDPNKVGNTLIADVDIDEYDNEDIVIEYNIRSIPLTLYVKNGIVMNKFLGSASADEMYKRIEEYK